MPEPDAGTCQQICDEGCASCFINDTGKCTACEEGYVLEEFTPKMPSRCITYEEACPDFCAICYPEAPFTCIECIEGYRLDEEANVCNEIIICHASCKDCNATRMPDRCIDCWENASIEVPHAPDGHGYCECHVNYLPTPDASNCDPICHENCDTCSGPKETECLSCPFGMKL